MEKSKESGRNETIELFKKVRKDLDDCRRENEELRKLLEAENAKRAKETKDIEEKLEKEKQDLRQSMEKDLSAENEARRKDTFDLRALLNLLMKAARQPGQYFCAV